MKKPDFRVCVWICALAYTLLLAGCDFGLDAPLEDANGIYLNTLSSVEESGDLLLIQGNNTYVISGNNITGFDVSDKFNPKQFPYWFALREINDAVAAGSYIYCACQYEFTIVDVSSPSSPSTAGSLELEYEPQGIEVDGHYAYLRAGNRLLIVDISSPADPVLVKVVQLENSLVDYVVDNSIGYLLFDLKVASYDFSDVANPVELCEIDFLWSCTTLRKSGEYLYIVGQCPDHLIATVGIGNPRKLKFIRLFRMPNMILDIDFDEYGVAGDYSTLYLLNIDNPSFPCVAEKIAGGAMSVVTRGDYIYYLSANCFAIVKVEEIK